MITDSPHFNFGESCHPIEPSFEPCLNSVTYDRLILKLSGVEQL